MGRPVKVIGIIAKHNPFHGGYKFRVEEAKKRAGASWCIAAMSGSFVQRREPAIYSKYLCARMALPCGADLVVGLPSVSAVSSMENFVACSMALFTGLEVVEALCLGSEDGNINRIQKAAGILTQESGDFSSLLSLRLRSGLSWPLVHNQVLFVTADRDKDFPLEREETDGLLGSSNNLLGTEYYKAILRQNSPLILLAIRRRGQGYHDEDLESGQAPASAIRRTFRAWELYVGTDLPLYTELTPESRTRIPPAIWSLYGQKPFPGAGDLSEILNLRLLSLRREGTDYTRYGNMSVKVACRLDSCLLQQVGWEGRVEQLKTCQYAYTRISRALLHVALGLTAARVQLYKGVGRASYARILRFGKESRELSTLVRQKTVTPLTTKTADAPHTLAGTALDMLSQDIYASHIRWVLLPKKLEKPIRNECNQFICILE